MKKHTSPSDLYEIKMSALHGAAMDLIELELNQPIYWVDSALASLALDLATEELANAELLLDIWLSTTEN